MVILLRILLKCDDACVGDVEKGRRRWWK